MTAHGYGLPFQGDANVLELESGDRCTTQTKTVKPHPSKKKGIIPPLPPLRPPELCPSLIIVSLKVPNKKQDKLNVR